jgi:hypothetical protein
MESPIFGIQSNAKKQQWLIAIEIATKADGLNKKYWNDKMP